VFEFIEKGFDSIQFIDSVERVIRTNQRAQFRNQVRRDARELLSDVSESELEVVHSLADGLPHKRGRHGARHQGPDGVQASHSHFQQTEDRSRSRPL